MSRASFAIVIILSLFNAAAQAQTIKVDVLLQQVTATVTDSEDKLVTNLSAEDFIVESDGVPQQIVHFTQDKNVPFSVGLVLDTSNSMEPTLAAAKAAASTFINGMHPRDDAFLMTFDISSTVRQGFTHDPEKLSSALRPVTIGGGTGLIDSVSTAAKKIREANNRKHALIVLSDGGDSYVNNSQIELFLGQVAGMETLVYTVQIQDINAATAIAMRATPATANTLPQLTAAFRPDLAHQLMESMAKESGGRYFYIDLLLPTHEVARQLSFAFDDIFTELRGQYTIGFYPPAESKIASRIRVRTVNPSYHVRTGNSQMNQPVITDDDPYETALETAQKNEQQGLRDAAIQALEHATTLNDSDPRAFRSLSRLYSASNQFQKAVEALNTLGSLTALSGSDQLLLGTALLELDDPARARDHFVRAIAAMPDSPEPYLHLYTADMKLNKPAEALSILEEYLKRFPDDRDHDLVVERVNKLRAIVKPPGFDPLGL